MTNIDSLDSSAREYFNSLPSMIKEQIIESRVTFSSKQDLENYYNAVTSHNQAK